MMIVLPCFMSFALPLLSMGSTFSAIRRTWLQDSFGLLLFYLLFFCLDFLFTSITLLGMKTPWLHQYNKLALNKLSSRLLLYVRWIRRGTCRHSNINYQNLIQKVNSTLILFLFYEKYGLYHKLLFSDFDHINL